jgi:hypothetical protein
MGTRANHGRELSRRRVPRDRRNGRLHDGFGGQPASRDDEFHEGQQTDVEPSVSRLGRICPPLQRPEFRRQQLRRLARALLREVQRVGHSGPFGARGAGVPFLSWLSTGHHRRHAWPRHSPRGHGVSGVARHAADRGAGRGASGHAQRSRSARSSGSICNARHRASASDSDSQQRMSRSAAPETPAGPE